MQYIMNTKVKIRILKINLLMKDSIRAFLKLICVNIVYITIDIYITIDM